MKVEVKPTGTGYWIASITVDSGNRYVYNSLLYQELSDTAVKMLWQAGRKHWQLSH